MRQDKRKAKAKARARARAKGLDVRSVELGLKAGGTESVPMASAESIGALGESMGLSGFRGKMDEALEALVADGALVPARTPDGRRVLLTPEQLAKYDAEPVSLDEGEETEPMDPEAYHGALVAEVKAGVRSGAFVLLKGAEPADPPLAIPAKDYDGKCELVPMEELDAVDVVSFTVADLVSWGMLAAVRERDGALGVRLPDDAMEEGLEPLPWTPALAAELSRQIEASA